jgi:hypothetical protein
MKKLKIYSSVIYITKSVIIIYLKPYFAKRDIYLLILTSLKMYLNAFKTCVFCILCNEIEKNPLIDH